MKGERRLTVYTGVNGLRIAVDLRLVDHIVELNNGVQLVTGDDVFAVRGKFPDILADVECAEGADE